jgi:hypothetical protein
MAKPRLSDPDSTPRFPYRGEVRREKPIWAREQFGPWQCDVLVTPITGMRAAYPIFEVLARWQQGPPLDENLGITPPRGMAAVDTYYVDREARDLQLTGQQAGELAIELAKHAADLLADGVKPDLRALARAIHKRQKGA